MRLLGVLEKCEILNAVISLLGILINKKACCS